MNLPPKTVIATRPWILSCWSIHEKSRLSDTFSMPGRKFVSVQQLCAKISDIAVVEKMSRTRQITWISLFSEVCCVFWLIRWVKSFEYNPEWSYTTREDTGTTHKRVFRDFSFLPADTNSISESIKCIRCNQISRNSAEFHSRHSPWVCWAPLHRDFRTEWWARRSSDYRFRRWTDTNFIVFPEFCIVKCQMRNSLLGCISQHLQILV